MPEAWKIWEGQAVDGFPLRRYLGGSEHSAVYLTYLDSSGQQNAAIKFIPADSNADAQLARWRAAGQLNHPNLLPLIRVGRCHMGNSDFLYVVMDYADEDLSQILPQRALEPDEARQMLAAVLDALTYLHGKGLAHTGIKPANILAAGDQLKVSTDTLCQIDSAPLPKPDATIYAAPEFATAPVSAALDVWSLGVTVVEALTQLTPVIRSHNRVEFPSPESIPPPYLEIARRSAQMDPARRASLKEISALLNPGVEPKRDPMLLPPNARVVPAEPLKKSLAAQHVSLAPHTLLPNSPSQVATATKPRRSRVGMALVVIPLLIIAILLAPRMLNRFSQLQPHADTVQPTIAPASELLDPPASVAKRDEEVAKAINPKAPPPAGTAKQPPPGTVPSSASGSTSAAKELAGGKPARGSGGNAAHGAVLFQVVPDVSEQARHTILGTVRVSVKAHVDANGNVTSAALENDSSRFFADQAVEVAHRWIFRPPQVDGRNAPSEWLLRFEFSPTATKVFPTQTSP